MTDKPVSKSQGTRNAAIGLSALIAVAMGGYLYSAHENKAAFEKGLAQFQQNSNNMAGLLPFQTKVDLVESGFFSDRVKVSFVAGGQPLAVYDGTANFGLGTHLKLTQQEAQGFDLLVAAQALKSVPHFVFEADASPFKDTVRLHMTMDALDLNYGGVRYLIKGVDVTSNVNVDDQLDTQIGLDVKQIALSQGSDAISANGLKLNLVQKPGKDPRVKEVETLVGQSVEFTMDRLTSNGRPEAAFDYEAFHLATQMLFDPVPLAQMNVLSPDQTVLRALKLVPYFNMDVKVDGKRSEVKATPMEDRNLKVKFVINKNLFPAAYELESDLQSMINQGIGVYQNGVFTASGTFDMTTFALDMDKTRQQ